MIRRLMLAAALIVTPAVMVAQPLPIHALQQDTTKAAKKPVKKHKKVVAKPAAKDTTKAK